MHAQSCILTINGGSSSIRFAVFDKEEGLHRRIRGKLQRIGLPNPFMTVRVDENESVNRIDLPARDHRTAIAQIIDWLEQRLGSLSISAIGHRVVHGGTRYGNAESITPQVIEELRKLAPLAPEHMPSEIELIEILSERFPGLPQVACFDTAFHRDMPRVAKLVPIPRQWEALGIQRFGFHGLSYEYLLEEIERVGSDNETNGRLVLAHLGNGASLAAVRHGKCVDTSMGFTPCSGLVMGTRSGDLDPGVVWYLMQQGKMTPETFFNVVNHRSGLLGMSETSSDMRDLLARETSDVRAAEAVELFCYQARKWIGAFAAALGGLDTLVFSGGIGENSAEIRKRICDGLGFLGIEIDSANNTASEAVISTPQSHVTVRVIPTDEELVIARKVCQIAGQS